jgi:DNA-binding transcriptional regulator PaaX
MELAEQCLLFMTEGSSGPYAAAMGREAYEAMLKAKNKKAERIQRQRALRKLKEQKLIRIQEKGENFAIAFTQEGKIVVLKQRIIEKADRLPNNKVCLVSFDVPEDIRYIRLMLRKLLKQAKFKQVHKSVWVTKHDVIKEFRHLINLLHAHRWMKIYEATEK